MKRPAPIALPRLLALAALSLAVAAGFVWLLLPSVRPGVVASGADTGSYLLTTQFIVDALKSTGHVRQINPAWYAGFAAFHNTPLAVYLVLAPVYALTGSLVTTSHVAHLVFALLAGVACFFALRTRLSVPASLAGAFLYATAPIVLDQTVYGGSYTRTFALTLGAACFPFVEGIVREGPRARWTVPWSLLVAFSLLVHPPTAAAFALCWSVYLFVRLLTEKRFAFRTLSRWTLAMAAAAGVAAWYLIPFFLEGQGWTSFPADVYRSYSITIPDGIRWLGWPLLGLLALDLVARRGDRVRTALLAAAAVALFLAGGVYTKLPTMIPGLGSVYPFVFLFFAAFAAAYLAGGAVDAAIRRGGMSAYLLGVLMVVALGAAGWNANAMAAGAAKTAPRFDDASDLAAAAHARDARTDGRVMLMNYPFTYLPFWVMSTSGKAGVEGWYYSLSPTGKHIAWAYEAIDFGFPEYAADLFERWNVRLLVENANFANAGARYEAFAKVLDERGYRRTFADGTNSVLASAAPSAYAMPVRARTLVVGTYASHPASILPGAVIADGAKLDDLTPEFLSRFDTLVLSGFSFDDRDRAERLVRDFAKGGGAVVVDLMGMEHSPLEESPFFLGVTAVRQTSKSGVDVRAVGPPSAASLPSRLALPGRMPSSNYPALTEWRYVDYLGLTASLADDANAPGQSLLGYKDVGGAKVWFVGGNAFYHAFLTRDPQELAMLRSLGTPAFRPTPQRGIRIADERSAPESYAFSAEASSSALVLVSTAYSRHWKATVDGKPARTYDLDDLVAVLVPPGRHAVRVVYGGLPLHTVADAVTILTLLALGVTLARDLRRTSDTEAPANEMREAA